MKSSDQVSFRRQSRHQQIRIKMKSSDQGSLGDGQETSKSFSDTTEVGHPQDAQNQAIKNFKSQSRPLFTDQNS